MGRETGDAGEPLPIDIGREADLAGEAGSAVRATGDIRAKLGQRVELYVDAARLEGGLQAAPIVEQPLDGRRIDRLSWRESDLRWGPFVAGALAGE
jgi:hypothetical protein